MEEGPVSQTPHTTPPNGSLEGDQSVSHSLLGGGQEPTAGEKQWAVLIHLSALLGFLVPFFNIFAPLLLWLFKQPKSVWLDAQAKQVINFQISFTLYAFLAGLSLFILVGFLILPILGIGYLIFLILGAIRASEGTVYKFPFTIQFIH